MRQKLKCKTHHLVAQLESAPLKSTEDADVDSNSTLFTELI